MQAVNLLPAYARPAGRWASLGKELSPARVVRIGGLVAVVAAIAVGAAWYYERTVVSDRHATLQDTKARLAAKEAIAAPLHAAEADSSARETIVRSVVSSRVQWEKVLHDLAAVLPDQVYLQSLQVQQATVASVAAPDTSSTSATSTATATPAPVTASSQLTVTGAANSHVRVALILDRLALLPWLSDITLQSSTHGGSGAGDNFSITAGFTGAEATG
jgi:Tfp pilus assembly protein PilN